MEPPRVLLVRAGALGDVLLLRRAIASLQRAGRIVGLLAPSAPAAAILGSGPADVAEALAWDSPAFAGLLQEDGAGDAAARVLRRYDAAIAYTRNDALTRGLRRVIPGVLQRDPAPPADGPHASRWLAACLPSIGVAPDGDVPLLTPSADDHARAAAIASALPPQFLALHPGSGSPAKNWPAARFAEIARRIGGTRWLLVRGPADDAAATPLESIPGALVARDLPLRVLAALLARAGAFVGNDSGISHLAAATGAPTVAVFGPTDPRLWSPVGPRVAVVHRETLDAVTVADVAAAVARVR